MLNLSNRALSHLRISIPNIAEQRSLLYHINALSKYSLDLESIYIRKVAALAELKQSILQKAFSGSLTSEVVELAEEALA
jgi:type I restriction enzyme S subunit